MQTHILICKRLKYIEEEQARILLDLADEIRKMLSVLINKENLI
ncbi:four helix bundle domain protein [Megasphaera vaginalis (ex Srinivasan et al. 2021)]|uniref:Four helix bundle domain protein n=1 Tax=Megasphaera vaginalis (ex Srinivasan et al. 2021) TaxID=1111454 RepID=U7UV07_9FIRM|nr:four helix bundle domain protein [Megasphaera vaginalis (ex Srinivasan et al. 2021)]